MTIVEKLLEKYKKGETVSIEDVTQENLLTLAIGDRCFWMDNEFFDALSVIREPKITKTARGRFVVEGTEMDSLHHRRIRYGFLARKLFKRPESIDEYWTGSSRIQLCAVDYCKMVEPITKVIPLYKE